MAKIHSVEGNLGYTRYRIEIDIEPTEQEHTAICQARVVNTYRSLPDQHRV